MNTSLRIIFSGCCEDDYSCAISIERDEDKNEGKSSFVVGDEIFYRVRPAGSYRYRVTNGGLMVLVSGTLQEEIEEEVVISGESVDAGNIISGDFEYNWVGKAINSETGSFCIPNVIVQLGTSLISLPYSVLGVLRLKYRSDYTLVKFAPINPGKQLIEVSSLQTGSEPSEFYEFGNGLCSLDQICASTYLEEDIISEEEAGEEVILRIIDACNDDPVPGAQVIVDGTLVEGITNVDGKINVGILSEGTYDIIVTADGFVPSNEDQLDNDQIEV